MKPGAKQMSRRAMLRGAGGVTIGLPLLDAFGCRNDRISDLMGPGLTPSVSAADGPPKRVVFFMTEGGTDPRAQFPVGTETEFTLPECVAALEPYKKNGIFTRGIDNVAAMVDAEDGDIPNTHYSAWSCQLTGRKATVGGTASGKSPGGISLDLFLADQLGTTTKHKFLAFSYDYHAWYGTGGNTISATGRNAPLNYEGRPERFFTDVFSGVSSSPGGMPDPALLRLHQDRQSVLDAVKPQFGLLQPALGAADRKRLQDHLDLIRDLEKQVTSLPPVTASCVPPPKPDDDEIERAGFLPSNTGFDLIAYALGCDLTRVATIMFNNGTESFTGASGSYHDDHVHNIMNSSSSAAVVRKTRNWIAGRLKYFLDKLKSIPEGAGTVFDNTLVVWCDEYTHGYDHKTYDMPYVLLSGGERFFRMGRNLDFGGRYENGNGTRGASNNQLWLSVRDAMGATGAFGDPALGSTPLVGL